MSNCKQQPVVYETFGETMFNDICNIAEYVVPWVMAIGWVIFLIGYVLVQLFLAFAVIDTERQVTQWFYGTGRHGG